MKKEEWKTGMQFGSYIIDECREDGTFLTHCTGCGKTYIRNHDALYSARRRNGTCRSCSSVRINRKCKVKHGALRDGVEAYKDYHILGNIVNRCHNPKNKDFPRYGGRGIIVESPWRVNGHVNYPAFHEWYVASEQIAKTVYDKKYWDKLQVDRIDNDGNYSPENCRLVPSHVQSFNRRNTTYIDGVSLAEWYESNKVMGSVSYTTFRTRVVRYKWDKERAISTPSKFPRTVREVIS